MKRTIEGLLTALTTVSRIPIPWRFNPNYDSFGLFLPLVGIAAAVPLWGVSYLSRVVPTVFAVVAGLAIQYWVFNLFHFDGLLDSADGMLFQGSRERRLEILKDSSIGSFALFAGVLYLIAKVSLLAACVEATEGVVGGRFLLFALAACAGRIGCAYVPLVLGSARPGGLGSMLAPYRPLPVLAGTVVVTGGGAAALVWATRSRVASTAIAETAGADAGAAVGQAAGSVTGPLALPWPWIGVAALASVVVTVAALATLFRAKIGGYTGDTLGATVEIGELAALAAMVAVIS